MIRSAGPAKIRKSFEISGPAPYPQGMRPFVQSFSIHLAIALLLILVIRHEDRPVEIPIELTEFLKARPKASSEPPHPRAPAPRVEPGKSAAPSSEPASHSTLPPSETVMEEYEVAELPVLLNEVRVPYPPSARSLRVQGAVILDLIIGSDGRVASSKIVSSPSQDLSDAALSAISRFRFRPAHFKDKPVAIQIRYTYRFKLE